MFSWSFLKQLSFKTEVAFRRRGKFTQMPYSGTSHPEFAKQYIGRCPEMHFLQFRRVFTKPVFKRRKYKTKNRYLQKRTRKCFRLGKRITFSQELNPESQKQNLPLCHLIKPDFLFKQILQNTILNLQSWTLLCIT